MRLTVGIVGILGLGASVAVATAQSPGITPAPRRSATLLAPVPFTAGEFPAVARGVADDGAPNLATTPVVRPGRNHSAGPVWLNGPESGVRPAGGFGVTKTPARPSAPQPANPHDEPSMMSKGYDKLKSAFASGSNLEKPALTARDLPPGRANVKGAPESAFRGTGANGAPVYAGPPAYRWYGWGSVTPGANPYAPSGQPPKASANWYSITGATPGAFPVPVMNPMRPVPGTEPPAYVGAPALQTNTATPAGGFSSGRAPTTYTPARQSDAVASVPASTSISKSGGLTETRPPVAPSGPVPNPAPVAVPALTAPPVMPTPPVAQVSLTPPAASETPPGTLNIESTVVAPIASPLPALPDLKAAAPAERPVAALPVSGTDEQPNWQPQTGGPSKDTWSPAAGAPRPTGSATTPSTPGPTWEKPGAARVSPAATVARGQVGEDRADPTATLIRNVCGSRAAGVDIRWTGSKKLTVAFECRTAADAQKVVKEISARPELKPYQIDFSVIVK